MRNTEDVTCLLAALDMDGTLLNTAHEMTPYTREVIARATEKGRIIALSTGRAFSELSYFLDDVKGLGYLIYENGASIYDVANRRVLRRIELSPENAMAIFDTAARFDVCIQAFLGDQSLIECVREEDLKKYHVFDFAPVFRAGSEYVVNMRDEYLARGTATDKINIFFRSEADRAEFVRRMEGRDLLMSVSIGIGLEISPAGATKALALEALCGLLNVPVALSMAVGDGGNDVEIMQAAGLGVAMGNAIEEVKAVADVVTEDCDHDGAAKAIERYMNI